MSVSVSVPMPMGVISCTFNGKQTARVTLNYVHTAPVFFKLRVDFAGRYQKGVANLKFE